MPVAASTAPRSDGLLERELKNVIVERLKTTDCVALLGPRQVGKTILAKEIVTGYPGAIYLDLQSPADLKKIGDGEELFAAHPRALIVLDEIQCRPDLFPVLRSQIDARRESFGGERGRFLILGSASLDLQRGASESLAGRISEIFLPGFQFIEVLRSGRAPLDAIQADTRVAAGPIAANPISAPPIREAVDRLWLRGGFPLSYLAANDQTSLQWRRDFIQTYTERDVATLGLEVDGQELRRCWDLIAARQGGLWNRARFASDLRIRGALIDEYISVLHKLLFIRVLRPWHANVGKRLIKSPKLYVRDSGLHHALLNFGTLDEVERREFAGPSWEGFVIETLINAARSARDAFFYRDENGAEMDLILEFSASNRWGIEIKLGENPNLTRGSISAAETMKVDRRIVVHSGPEKFAMENDFEAMPLFDACDAVASA